MNPIPSGLQTRLLGLLLIVGCPLAGQAQSFDISQIETKLRNLNLPSVSSSLKAKVGKAQEETANENSTSQKSNTKPKQKGLEKPLWFSPEYQKILMGGVATGGGDDDGIKFQATAAKGIYKLSPFLSSEQRKLAQEALSKARFLVVDEKVFAQLNGVTQESVALNDPKTGIIQIGRERWKQIEGQPVGVALSSHEVLSVVKIESTGRYDYSSKLLADPAQIKKAGDTQTLFSKYIDKSSEGYDSETAYQNCERVKSQNEDKFYLVYCTYFEKNNEKPHNRHFITYGLQVIGVGNSKTLSWKTVFSSMRFGRSGQFSDFFENETAAANVCFETLRDNITNQPSWIEPRCFVKRNSSGFYYEIQTQNPMAR